METTLRPDAEPNAPPKDDLSSPHTPPASGVFSPTPVSPVPMKELFSNYVPGVGMGLMPSTRGTKPQRHTSEPGNYSTSTASSAITVTKLSPRRSDAGSSPSPPPMSMARPRRFGSPTPPHLGRLKSEASLPSIASPTTPSPVGLQISKK